MPSYLCVFMVIAGKIGERRSFWFRETNYSAKIFIPVS